MKRDLRRVARLTVIVAGIVTLIGSGGGFPPFELDLSGIGQGFPAAEMDPPRQVVQVGTAVRFTVRTSRVTQPTFQWCRVAFGSESCDPIVGAASDSLLVPSANLADDGAIYRVTVTDPAGTSWAGGQLYVSRQPAVVMQDGDFAAAAWAVRTVADPATGGPSAAVTTQPSDGHPGAFRQTVVTVPAVPASIRVEQVAQAATYAPAAQGAVYLIDFGIDCRILGTTTTNAVIWTTPLIEQAGRVYLADSSLWSNCASDAWTAVTPRVGIAASDFKRVSGAACGAGEACPDFGVAGAELRLGFAHVTEASAAALPGSRTRGIDNWRVTIWRR